MYFSSWEYFFIFIAILPQSFPYFFHNMATKLYAVPKIGSNQWITKLKYNFFFFIIKGKSNEANQFFSTILTIFEQCWLGLRLLDSMISRSFSWFTEKSCWAFIKYWTWLLWLLMCNILHSILFAYSTS